MTLTQQIRKELKELPPIGGGAGQWFKNRKSLRHHINTEKFEDFTKWSTIQATMYRSEIDETHEQFKRLPKKWKDAIIEPWVGNPEPYSKDIKTSSNFINQAFVASRFDKKILLNFEDMDSIVEIGAGYGALCHIIHQLGFKGDYYIIDIPEMELIQRVYLGSLGIYPFFEKEKQIESELLISFTALSEIDKRERQEILNRIDAKKFAITFQPYFHQVNNVTFFDKFSRGMKNYLLWAEHFTRHTFFYGESK